jgi:predicted dehydrogenase
MIRVGIVDFDTSHVIEFIKRFNHIDVEEGQWIDGVRVVMGYPGSSAITGKDDILERTRTMRDKYGIDIVDRPEDMIGKIDAVMIESQEGATHLKMAKPFLSAGIPTFIDKPFASSLGDAKALGALAKDNDAPLFSTSSLRYALEVQEVRSEGAKYGGVVGADAYSPASLHPRNPGLFHYGIHGVETLYALMGPGCRAVSCTYEDNAEVIVGRWGDGRIGTVRGLRHPPHDYGFTAFCEGGIVAKAINTAYIYREMLKRIAEMFQTRKPPIDIAETIEIVSFIEGALVSAKSRGASAEVRA